ncbi:uncharacterized protein TNCV_405801 [Trichonephila clavipes]|nr:uncharacterized protein TNCV_405801 [Trichonephila clavipes]
MSWTYRSAALWCHGSILGVTVYLQFSRAWHHSKRWCRWVRVKGSTRNGHHDPKCPLARRLRMVREDTWAPSEGTTCAWMATDEAVGRMRAFLTIWRSSRRLVCRVNDISRIHWSQHLFTTQSVA